MLDAVTVGRKLDISPQWIEVVIPLNGSIDEFLIIFNHVHEKQLGSPISHKFHTIFLTILKNRVFLVRGILKIDLMVNVGNSFLGRMWKIFSPLLILNKLDGSN